MAGSGGTYYGDMFRGDPWPPRPSQSQAPVRGAKGGLVGRKGDQRPGVTVRRL